jgi:hypothetical protein
MRRRPVVLVELGLVELRYQAVLEVLNDGATITDVARRFGVARQATIEGLGTREVAVLSTRERETGTPIAQVGRDPGSARRRWATGRTTTGRSAARPEA